MYTVGEVLYVMITGTATVCRARVVSGGKSDSPHIEILGRDNEPSPVWPVLKPGAYIICGDQDGWDRRFMRIEKKESTPKTGMLSWILVFILPIILCFLLLFPYFLS
jgi:hypothetical protein